MWRSTANELVRAQRELAVLRPPRWQPLAARPLVGACYVCFARGKAGRGRAGENGWAAAVLMPGNRGLVESAVAVGATDAPYEPGLLALREGPLLEAALRALSERPEVLLSNATGRDHPRAAGLALQLGAVLDLPSIGVTGRPLRAEGREPGAERGATSPVLLGGVEVARMLRTRAGARPVVVHRAGAPASTRRSPWCSPRPAAPGHRSRYAAPGRSLATPARRQRAGAAAKAGS